MHGATIKICTQCGMWNKKPTICHLVVYLFLLYKLLNMFQATLCPSSGADNLVVFCRVWCSAVIMGSVISRYVWYLWVGMFVCFHVLLGGLLWLVVSAVVNRCDLMCKLIKLHTRGCVGGQIRLAGCVSIGEYVAQLTLLVWGWVRWMARLKSGFGQPGDCSEMRLPCLWKECM